MKKRIVRDRAQINNRLFISFICILLVFFVLIIRLSWIMIGKHSEYSALANEQWTSEVKIDARRGKILDRNGSALAVSADVYRVDLDLNSIRSYLSANEDKEQSENSKKKLYTTNEEVAKDLAEATGMEESEVLEKLNTKLNSGQPAGSAILIRRVEKDIAEKVKALNINGIMVSADTKRYYPENNFLAHVLGSTNSDGQGLTGVELEYNDLLSGVPGRKISEIDSKGQDYPYTISEYTKPVDGSDLTLTIDQNIQHFAEKVAQQSYTDNKAKAVSVLVMDPNTGEILAMVNKPDFNPNTPYDGVDNFEGDSYSDKLQKMWRNRLVNDTFEPGSIFKVITGITAMEENVVSDSDAFTCNGSLNVAGTTIRCWRTQGHGTQAFNEIFQNSCNVAFMNLGEKIGKETLYEYIKKFGFGELTNVDLPGEAAGIVKKPENISVVDLATIAFGQTNTVNSVQYLTAFNAVANGGTWIQPHVMKEATHTDENNATIVDKTFEPTKRTVASEEKCATLRTYLEKVITSGSGTKAYVEGYHIAGKTGTAQKVVNGVYGDGKYISTFVGMAPVDNPKVTVMITVDEPSNGEYYAGSVAAPYAHTLFTDIFNYMDSKFEADSIEKEVIIPEVRGMKVSEAKKALEDLKLTVEVSSDGDKVKSVKPYPGYAVKEGSTITLNTSGIEDTNVVMPDVTGYSLDKAKEQLAAIGILVNVNGDSGGEVVNQSITPGELIKKQTTVTLSLRSNYED